MICTDIVYVRADDAEEAIRAWQAHAGPRQARPGQIEARPEILNEVRYLNGGTEIVTGARKIASTPGVLIDIKRIPEAARLGRDGDSVYLGAAATLNEAGDSGYFPLLSAVVRRVADRTTRNRLSLGGNVAGALPYREAVLPLLLADATMLSIAPAPAPSGDPERRSRPLREVFFKRLALDPGELVLGFSVPAAATELPWRHYRATRTGPVDYPLVTACFMRGAQGIAAAFTGLHPYPVLFESIGDAAPGLSAPGTAKRDQRATAEYRLALALDMLARAGKELS